MFPSTWSDDRIEQLKSLWQEGLSARQVAHALGNVTRNAALGKLHRLGLLASSTEARPPRLRSSIPRSRPVRLAKIALVAAVPEPNPFTFDGGNFATVASVNDRMCRWPIGDPKAGDFHFCGHALKAGSCYCEAHTQRAHQPGPPKRRPRIHRVAVAGAGCVSRECL
jgi:GcrA cell cycle regulator